MKTLQLAMAIAVSALLSTVSYGQTTGLASHPVPTKSFHVVALDLSGGKGLSTKEIQSGKDQFLVRQVAGPIKVSKHTTPMLKDSKGTPWTPVSLGDLRKADTNHDNKLSAQEATAAGFALATVTPKGLQTTSLGDKKITEIDIPTGISKKVTFIESKGGPIKGEVLTVKLPVAK